MKRLTWDIEQDDYCPHVAAVEAAHKILADSNSSESNKYYARKVFENLRRSLLPLPDPKPGQVFKFNQILRPKAE